jgi:hypothetical protein
MIRRVAAFLIITIAATQPVLACAPAPHAGENIDIVEESAVIRWDPATKTEQFIRRATFKGTAKDFGFLVPTPATPALEEVSDDLFTQLETKTARKTVQKTTKTVDWTPLVLLLLAPRKLGEGATMAPAGARAAVEVLSIQKLAGYEAAVLDATDAKALNEWLAKNGYATTPDLAEWLDAYIKQGWKITAFKIDKSRSEITARTSAVKMTFQTERPFFPYREPRSERAYDSVRSLTIFFQGPERVSGVVGEKELWPGVMTWSDTHLTKFVDTSNIRPGFDDLFFVRDKDQSPFELPPIVNENIEATHLPADVLAVAAVILLLILRRIRR